MRLAHLASSSLFMVVGLLAGCGAKSDAEQRTTMAGLGMVRAGVDVDEETNAVVAGLRDGGWSIETQLDGPGYRAFDARHRDGRTAIRVVTVRGIAAALTVPMAEREQHIALRRRDGMGELIVARADPSLERECLSLLRVHEDGRVTQVFVELGRFGAAACVEGIEDVGGDPRPELITVLRLGAGPSGSVPEVQNVLEARGEGYSPAAPNGYRAFWERELGARVERYEAAKRDLDADAAYVVAVELAAIARERGLPQSAQLSAFDEALGGFVLTEAQAQAAQLMRQHISDGWPE